MGLKLCGFFLQKLSPSFLPTKKKKKKGLMSKGGARPKRATSGSKHARETRANNNNEHAIGRDRG